MIIISKPESIVIKNVIYSYYYGFLKNNIKAVMIELNDRYKDDIWILSYDDTFRIFDNEDLLPKKYIYIQTEPLSFFLYQKLKTQENKDMYINILKNAIYVFDYYNGNKEIMEKYDINNFVFFPVLYTGYYKKLYNIHNSNKPNKKTKDKTIDIMFVGTLSLRRKKIIKRLNNYKLYIKKEIPNKRKDNILYDSKLYFSLDTRVDDGINFTRLIPTIETKNYLVLETNTDIDSIKMVEDYVDFVSIQDYANKCKELIENPDIIDEKIERAYNFIKDELNFDNYLHKIELFNNFKCDFTKNLVLDYYDGRVLLEIDMAIINLLFGIDNINKIIIEFEIDKEIEINIPQLDINYTTKKGYNRIEKDVIKIYEYLDLDDVDELIISYSS